MGQRILIIENDDALARLMRLQLSRGGYDVIVRGDGPSGQEAAREQNPDLILLDVLLPDVSGWVTYDALREITPVPILFVTVLGTEEEITRGLEMGADDYIVKPFSYVELLTRVKAALYRARRTTPKRSVYERAPLVVDLQRGSVEVDGEATYLTPLEYKLLATLVRNAGRVVAHRTLLRRVWGPQHEERRQYLKLYIWYLRQKLEPNPSEPRLILTERGVGYYLAPPAEPA
jgi:two-component system KDP operon response regulator KdpE